LYQAGGKIDLRSRNSKIIFWFASRAILHPYLEADKMDFYFTKKVI
jgi:hypothetical protein